MRTIATTLTQDLVKLRKYKREAETKQNQADTAKRRHKDWEQHCLLRMEAEGAESHKAYGTTFSPVKKQFASIQDRGEFVRWAQDNEPDLIQYKERGAEVNQLVRQRLDDGEPLPPGVGFYDREYISQRSV